MKIAMIWLAYSELPEPITTGADEIAKMDRLIRATHG